jgi:tetratricopeptide (TPR) repeat protein
MRNRILAQALVVTVLAAHAVAQPKAKSQKEVEGYMAIQNATTADARIEAVDKFVTTFADSQLKSMALFMAADAEQRKNESAKAIAYAQSALEADPKSYEAMLLISGELAKGTRENDLDKEEKLARAEKLANEALPPINAAPKPNPQVSDEQWNGYKKDKVSQVHEDLGLIAMARKKYDVAATEFKIAVESAATPDPATSVRLATAYDQAGKPDEAIAVLDKVLATPNLNDVIKKYAAAEKTRAEQAKNKK